VKKRQYSGLIIILCLAISFFFILCNTNKKIDDNSSNQTISNNDDPINSELGEQITYPDLRKLIENLTPEQKQYLSNKLYDYSQAPTIEIEEGKGFVFGNKDALYHLIVFSDFNCPHCFDLAMTLAYLEKQIANEIYIESREFPLDNVCNRIVPDDHYNNGSGSCEMAKAAICAGKQGKYYKFKEAMFLMDAEYKERIDYAIKEANLNVEDFNECIISDYADNKLNEDIETGIKLNITSTPYLIWNKKKVNTNKLTIVAMLLSFSNPNHSIFKSMLPKPEK